MFQKPTPAQSCSLCCLWIRFKFSVTAPVSCLAVSCHTPLHGGQGSLPGAVNKPQLSILFCVSLSIVSLHNKRTVIKTGNQVIKSEKLDLLFNTFILQKIQILLHSIVNISSDVYQFAYLMLYKIIIPFLTIQFLTTNV